MKCITHRREGCLNARRVSSRSYATCLQLLSDALCSTVQLCAAVPRHSVDITGPTPLSTLVLYSYHSFPFLSYFLLATWGYLLFLSRVGIEYWIFFNSSEISGFSVEVNYVSQKHRLCSPSHSGIRPCSDFYSESPPFWNCSRKAITRMFLVRFLVLQKPVRQVDDSCLPHSLKLTVSLMLTL